MRTIILAAAALSLGIGSAYASDSEGASGNPVYVFPGTVYAGAQKSPPAATAQSGPAVHTFVAGSSQGTWLFAPAQGGNG
jgi:hypothetical protein